MLRSTIRSLMAVVASLGCVALGLTNTAAPVAAASTGVPAFDHVFVIVMENHSYANIIGNTAQAPYINQLANQGGLATNYAAITHPSLPNYLALIGGSTFGVTTDCTTCYIAAPNLVADRIAPSGRTWKAYMESMPSTCDLSGASPYVVRHNPFIYFNDIRQTAQCQNDVPMTRLSADLASASTTPSFGWITPNVCHDMHDCSVSTGDSWLKSTVPTILNSPAFTTQNSLLVITFDENDSSTGNLVPTLLLGKSVAPGTRSATAYSHYSLLHTIEAAWGLAPLTTNDANAPLLTAFFSPTSTTTTTSAPSAPSTAIKVVHETNVTLSTPTTSVKATLPATTAGHTLAVVTSLATGLSHSVGSITDSSGSTWTIANHVASAVSGVNARQEIWWRTGVPSGITSLTLSLPAGQTAVSAWTVKVVELSGVATAAALDTTSTAANASTTTLRSGRATAAGAGELALGAVATPGGSLQLAPQQPSTGWTALSDLSAGSSGQLVARAAYYPHTTAGAAYEADWSTATARSGGGAIVLFKPAAS